jgi:hypothetical protein
VVRRLALPVLVGILAPTTLPAESRPITRAADQGIPQLDGKPVPAGTSGQPQGGGYSSSASKVLASFAASLPG